ncbi:hypothetical protein IWX46DRAFT_449245 [Phyllosticta citricarpa]|uniref:Secreted protein n=1 Tax=Phyllosticta citricarpa TaxID=55181 RepID=A0ABR1MIG7_9PEZI
MFFSSWSSSSTSTLCLTSASEGVCSRCWDSTAAWKNKNKKALHMVGEGRREGLDDSRHPPKSVLLRFSFSSPSSSSASLLHWKAFVQVRKRKSRRYPRLDREHHKVYRCKSWHRNEVVHGTRRYYFARRRRRRRRCGGVRLLSRGAATWLMVSP